MKDRVVNIAKDLISYESVSPARRDIFDYLVSYLEPLGFQCHLRMFEDGAYPVYNLYAILSDADDPGRKHMGFAGHVDVVPTGELSRWESDPFTPIIKDGKLYGRGAQDMKTGVACMLSAIGDLAADIRDAGLNFSFLITGDEERDSVDGTNAMLEWMSAEGMPMPDYVLLGEPTSGSAVGDTVKIGRRGSAVYEIVMRGVQGHSAYLELADNACDKLVHALADILQLELDSGTEYFSPSTISIVEMKAGSGATNVVPGEAYAKLNARFNTEHTVEKIKTLLSDICARHAEDFSISASSNADPFLCKSDFANTICSIVSEVTGSSPELATTGGSSDARFIQKYTAVCELGVRNNMVHKANEYVVLEDLYLLEDIYRRICKDFCSTGGF